MQYVRTLFFAVTLCLLTPAGSGSRTFSTLAHADDSPFTPQEITQIHRTRSAALNQLGLELNTLSKFEREIFLSLRNPGAARTIRIHFESFLSKDLPQLQARVLSFKQKLEREISTHETPEADVVKQLEGNHYEVERLNQTFKLEEKKSKILGGYFSLVMELARIRAFAGAERISQAFTEPFSIRFTAKALNSISPTKLPAPMSNAMAGQDSELNYDSIGAPGDRQAIFKPSLQFLQGVEVGVIGAKKGDDAFFSFAKFVMVRKLYSELGEVQSYRMKPAQFPALPEKLAKQFDTLGLGASVHQELTYARNETAFRRKLVQALLADNTLAASLLTPAALKKIGNNLPPAEFLERFDDEAAASIRQITALILQAESEKQIESIHSQVANYILYYPYPLSTVPAEELAKTLRNIILLAAQGAAFTTLEATAENLARQFETDIVRNPLSTLEYVLDQWKTWPQTLLNDAARAKQQEVQKKIEEIRAIAIDTANGRNKAAKAVRDYFKENPDLKRIPFRMGYGRSVDAVVAAAHAMNQSLTDYKIGTKITEAQHYMNYARYPEERKELIRTLIASSRELDEVLKAQDREIQVDLGLLDSALAPSYQQMPISDIAAAAKQAILRQDSQKKRRELYAATVTEYLNGFARDCRVAVPESLRTTDDNGLIRVAGLTNFLEPLRNSPGFLQRTKNNIVHVFTGGSTPVLIRNYGEDMTQHTCEQTYLGILHILTIGRWFGLAKPYGREQTYLSDLDLEPAQIEFYKAKLKDKHLSQFPILSTMVDRTSWRASRDIMLYQKLAAFKELAEDDNHAQAEVWMERAFGIFEQNILTSLNTIADADNVKDLANVVTRTQLLNLLLHQEVYAISDNLSDIIGHQERIMREFILPGKYETLWHDATSKYFLTLIGYQLSRWLLPIAVGLVGSLSNRFFGTSATRNLTAPAVRAIFNDIGKLVNPFFRGYVWGSLMVANWIIDTRAVLKEGTAKHQVGTFFMTSSAGPSFYAYEQFQAVEAQYDNHLWWWKFGRALDTVFIGGGILFGRQVIQLHQRFYEWRTMKQFERIGFPKGEFSWDENAIKRMSESALRKIHDVPGWSSAEISRAEVQIRMARDALLARIEGMTATMDRSLDALMFEYERLGVPHGVRDFEVIQSRMSHVSDLYRAGRVSRAEFQAAANAYNELKAVLKADPNWFMQFLNRFHQAIGLGDAQQAQLSKFWQTLYLRSMLGGKPSDLTLELYLGSGRFQEATINPGVY